MSVETTLNIHETTLGLIDDACAATGAKRNQVIVMLFAQAMDKTKNAIRTGSLIRYQDRDREETWHTVHVRFREDEADYFKDLRNFLKLSDSLILAIAAREYINDIIRKLICRDKSDNYRYSNYIISREEWDGLVFWRICWGFPEEPQKYIRL